ncbi:hypothetical protein [Fournierella massiliensis]|uniref:5-methylcytosine restriction system specificity protein McrC n=1 Tax=Allofournierella massiliensis TaxID=1650663 RepID=UPI003521FA50
MKLLRVKDNRLMLKSDFAPIQRVVDKIADKTLSKLEKEGVFVFPEKIHDAPDIEEEQVVLQSYNNCYRTGNIMGFLGCGSERLAIESRFSSGDKDYFFQYLLERVMNFPNVVDLSVDANQENMLFNLMLFLFPRYLKDALRKGLFKTYIRNQYNDSHVAGSMDIPRHIAQNTPFIGNIAYSQREYSYDNDLTELVRHTIEFIQRKPYGRILLSKVKEEVSLVVDATNRYRVHDKQKVIAANQKTPIRHAYYREYRHLQHLCLLILQHQKHQIGTGTKQVYGILFDGAWLWEEYINLIVGDIFYHPMNRAGQGAQRLFAGNIGLIYPDFISKDSQNRVIGDAKYKPAENIGNKDYLQVLAYMLRFDAKNGFYFYLSTGDAQEHRLQMNKGSTYEKNVVPRNDVCVVKLGLGIPDCTGTYKEFTQKVRIAETVFQARLAECV